MRLSYRRSVSQHPAGLDDDVGLERPRVPVVDLADAADLAEVLQALGDLSKHLAIQ